MKTIEYWVVNTIYGCRAFPSENVSMYMRVDFIGFELVLLDHVRLKIHNILYPAVYKNSDAQTGA